MEDTIKYTWEQLGNIIKTLPPEELKNPVVLRQIKQDYDSSYEVDCGITKFILEGELIPDNDKIKLSPILIIT